MKKREKLYCECPGHYFPINPNDCICSPDDAEDLSKCKRMNQLPTIKRMGEEFDKMLLHKVGNRVGGYNLLSPEICKTFFSSYFLEVLEYLKLKTISSVITVTNQPYLKEEGELNGYNQAVSELNAKIKKLKGEE